MRGLGDIDCSWGCLDANPHHPSDAAFNLKDDVCKEEGKIAGGEAHSGRRKIRLIQPCFVFRVTEPGARFWARMPSPRGGEEREGSAAHCPLLPLPPTFGGTIGLRRASRAAKEASHPCFLPVSAAYP